MDMNVVEADADAVVMCWNSICRVCEMAWRSRRGGFGLEDCEVDGNANVEVEGRGFAGLRKEGFKNLKLVMIAVSM